MSRRKILFVSLAALMVIIIVIWVFGPWRNEKRTADPTSRRMTNSGAVVGFQERYGGHAWFGIPFARPPVGSLRWRAPQPPESWAGTREALDFGPACTQFGGLTGNGAPEGGEDCLYLNVYAPRFTEDQVPKAGTRLPVMFWIHGGGNFTGKSDGFAGGNLAATHKVVVITTNYRLGPFGWFRHAALRAETDNELDRSGNFGTLDFVRALQWVQENAAAFGGDPDNVTIFGESSGGLNVISLLVSPLAHGLFHRAISESGSISKFSLSDAENFIDDNEPGHPDSSNEVLLRLLIKDGMATDRGAAKERLAAMSLSDVARYLRGKTSSEILSVYTPEYTGIYGSRHPFVFRDGVVLPQEEAMQRFAQPDGYNKVPVMLGTNRDEYKLFMLFDPIHVRRIAWIIPRMRDERQYNLVAEYHSKSFKATGVDEPATLLRATQGPNVFAYRFDWDEEPRILGTDLAVMLGAAHGVEIPFVSGNFEGGFIGKLLLSSRSEPDARTLSGQMMSYWAEFAYHGNPGRGREGSLPEWTPWDNSTPKSPKFMILDTPSGGGLRMSPDMVSEKSLLAAIDADPRLPKQRDKCMVYRELASWGWYADFTRKDYPTAGKNGCKEFPFDKYPWK
jgi:para-nitrobenzyl esterase